MKKITILSLLATLVFISQCSQEKEVKVPETNEPTRIHFEEYSPYTCGANVKEGNIVIERSVKQEIKCIFKGCKNVGLYTGTFILNLIEKIGKKYPDKEIRYVLAQDTFVPNKELFEPSLPEERLILFSEEGKKDALLLQKAINEGKQNCYLLGKLLGYDEEDIKYFYLNDNEEYGIEEFLKDKEFTEEFIRENSSDQ